MKKINADIIANEKIGIGFYKIRVRSQYLAKNTKPGQFFEVRCCDGVTPLLRRPLSCHHIMKDHVEMLYEVLGPATEALSSRKPGEALDLIGPLGKGFDIESRGAVIVAGGIGVAPMLALAEKLKDAVVLIGGRRKSHVLCENDFKKLGHKVIIATDDGSKGHRGFVTELLQAELPDRRTIYACGPHAMLKVVAGIAARHRIDCQVSLEERMACGLGVCLGCPVKIKPDGYKMVCKDGPVFDSKIIGW